ncbi:MgtC/SapB family protein [Paracoccus sp. MC1862]|uniref:MgtC/SapB family protein n=1 Tax=Paracoccus sp. MC1862 TaxID=2760307 RepID=UPI001F3C172F|nr:MgtC/SapB family protein [Paracoccus sp. MC1862]
MPDYLTQFLSADIGLPLLASLITGVLIGIDREVQGKPAGLRTHALVCLAATLLTLAAAQQELWTLKLVPGTQIVSDPTRMAHGILTGIGFLGAGVIFREGPSVHGLTTAASLWISAALGIVYGVGMFGLALIGTAATLLVLVGLRILYAVLPRSSGLRLTVAVRDEEGLDVAGLRRLLQTHGLPDQPLSQSYDAQARSTTFTARTWGASLADRDRLAEALRAHPAVLGFTLMLAEDAGAPEVGS